MIIEAFVWNCLVLPGIAFLIVSAASISALFSKGRRNEQG